MESVISAYCPIPHHLAVWSTKYTWFQFPNKTSNLRFEIQLNTFHQDDLNSAFLFKICMYIYLSVLFFRCFMRVNWQKCINCVEPTSYQDSRQAASIIRYVFMTAQLSILTFTPHQSGFQIATPPK